MDTIEDKLSRLAQTKSDIRNALLKTGIAVPADAKFSDYITKILEAPCYKFPDLPGDVTRWSFKGLTNEQMSKNPRLEDADHKGRFLTFKNFAWGEMSGVGGYTQNYNNSAYWKLALDRAETTKTGHSFNVTSVTSTVVAFYYQSRRDQEPFTVKSQIVRVSGLTDGQSIKYKTGAKSVLVIESDGIYTLPPFDFAAKGTWYGFSFGKIQESCNITLEQLPYYPGFIIGDGVDDYAVTEKNFDFQDTYTVYTAFIPFKSSTDYPALCGKDYKKDFYINFRGDSLSNINFYSVDKYLFSGLLNGFNLFACKRTANKIVIKNLITGASKESDIDSLIENPGLYYLWKSAVIAQYSKAAIAGQVICNGHFTSDEEDTKVLNWYKKEYPWLFFDQAWTVTGKSNEDTDRATIANITGNGNNLVLSNFGFAGNSGYGEYAQNFNGYGFGNLKTITYTRTAASMKLDVPAGSSENIYSNVDGEAPIGFVYNFNLKITGLKTGNLLSISQGATLDNIIADINQDGVYNIKATVDDSWNQRRIYFWIRNSNGPETTLSIEQIPEYEGYLVTDGVDDQILSSPFRIDKKFTVLGEWKFLNNVNIASGIVKSSSFFIYNAITGTKLFLNSTTKIKVYPTKSLKAFCSDGRVYDSNWVEYLQGEEQTIDSSVSSLILGINGDKYAQLALKNIAIFNGKYLSKEDMIKAYIYLQTLKAK